MDIPLSIGKTLHTSDVKIALLIHQGQYKEAKNKIDSLVNLTEAVTCPCRAF